jgi:hypothetical protein
MSGYSNGFCQITAKMTACTQGLLAPEALRVKVFEKIKQLNKTSNSPQDKEMTRVKKLLSKLNIEEIRRLLLNVR